VKASITAMLVCAGLALAGALDNLISRQEALIFDISLERGSIGANETAVLAAERYQQALVEFEFVIGQLTQDQLYSEMDRLHPGGTTNWAWGAFHDRINDSDLSAFFEANDHIESYATDRLRVYEAFVSDVYEGKTWETLSAADQRRVHTWFAQTASCYGLFHPGVVYDSFISLRGASHKMSFLSLTEMDKLGLAERASEITGLPATDAVCIARYGVINSNIAYIETRLQAGGLSSATRSNLNTDLRHRRDVLREMTNAIPGIHGLYLDYYARLQASVQQSITGVRADLSMGMVTLAAGDGLGAIQARVSGLLEITLSHLFERDHISNRVSASSLLAGDGFELSQEARNWIRNTYGTAGVAFWNDLARGHVTFDKIEYIYGPGAGIEDAVYAMTNAVPLVIDGNPTSTPVRARELLGGALFQLQDRELIDQQVTVEDLLSGFQSRLPRSTWEWLHASYGSPGVDFWKYLLKGKATLMQLEGVYGPTFDQYGIPGYPN
jgi:hypothetical protein